MSHVSLGIHTIAKVTGTVWRRNGYCGVRFHLADRNGEVLTVDAYPDEGCMPRLEAIVDAINLVDAEFDAKAERARVEAERQSARADAEYAFGRPAPLADAAE